MAAPNVQEVVHGALIIVTLLEGRPEASFVIQYKGNTSHPKHVDISHYLKHGKTDREALNEVLTIVKGVVESAGAAGLMKP